MPENTSIQIESANIKVTPYGLEFPGTPSLKEWKQAMLGLQKAETMIQFYLGDLFIYAESAVTGWGKVTYQDLIDHSGYSYSSVTKFVWVSRKFNSDFRKEVCNRMQNPPNWSSYQVVASLDDDEAFRLLQLGGKSGWSQDRFQDEVKKLKSGGKEPDNEHWINLAMSRQEAMNLIDILADYPEDPIAHSISGRLGTLLEAE